MRAQYRSFCIGQAAAWQFALSAWLAIVLALSVGMAQPAQSAPRLALAAFCDGIADIPPEECQALEALFNSTDGPNWTIHTGWLESPAACTWYGVTCAAGHVSQLSLVYNHLSGSLPAELGILASLTRLNLNENQLTGYIPPELGNLANLDALGLASNQLEGSIPSDLGSLTSLTLLNLGQNQLSGNIPAQLGNLANLTYLNLSSNQLVDNIPGELGSLASLEWLILDFNQLSGSIPPGLGDLVSLQVLEVNDNQLDGEIPTELGNLANLQELHLNGNQLSGSIPASLGDLYYLTCLSLGNNQLTGSIPGRLGNLENLQELSLNNNQLGGSIPSELGGLVHLTMLDLSVNQLSSIIPAQLGNLANLTFLNLSDNQLADNIPSELGSLTSLQWISLEFNQLSGSIPAELGNLSNLGTLTLNNNQLSDSIPSELGNLASLEWLDLRENQLSGTIPTALGNLANLTYLDLSGNQLSGSIPAELGTLANLETLRLAQNALEGDIPASLANLKVLSTLSLFYNRLTASDPGVIALLNNVSPTWAQTQTVAPGNLQAVRLSTTSARLTWTPILYTVDGGGYEVSYATIATGPFTVLGTTSGKTANQYDATGLPDGATVYFRLRAHTPPHANNQNDLWSSYTPLASVALSSAPQASFTAQPITGLPPLPVSFTNTSTGVITGYEWDFGDGETSTETNPQHKYYISGTYTVALTVSGPGGKNTYTRTNYIVVNEGAQYQLVPGSSLAAVYEMNNRMTTIIVVHPAAVTQAVTMQFVPLYTIPTYPAGFGYADLAFDLSVYLGGVLQPNFQFNQPLLITIEYGDDHVLGMSEKTLTLMYWDGSAWQEAACGAYQRDPAANKLTVPVCHLTTFGLFAKREIKTYLPLIVR